MAAPQVAGFPSWTGADPNSKDWDSPILGHDTLPGFWKVENLELAVEVKHKRAKGSDQHTSKDIGCEVGKFKLRGRVLSWQLQTWAEILGRITPHKPGRVRAPLGIIHPLINLNDITNVHIVKIAYPEQPNAKSAMEVVLDCEEWFDAPKETKTTNRATTAGRGSLSNREAAAILNMDEIHRRTIERNRLEGRRDLSAMPDNPTTVSDSLFD